MKYFDNNDIYIKIIKKLLKTINKKLLQGLKRFTI